MKNLIRSLVIAFLCLPALAVPPATTPLGGLGAYFQTTTNGPAKLVFSFNYTPTGTWPVCTSALTNLCVSSFVLSDTTNPAAPVVLATIPATTATNYGYTLTALPPGGNHTYQVVAVGLYNGGDWDSAPDTFSLVVPTAPAAPTGGTVVAQ